MIDQQVFHFRTGKLIRFFLSRSTIITHIQEITECRIFQFYLTVFIHIFFRSFHFQRNHIQHIRHGYPFVVKVLIFHRILQTIFFKTFNSILFIRFIPPAHIIQLGSRQRHFDKQPLNQRILQFEQFLVLSVIIRNFLFGDIIRQLLVYQFLLISMHNQRFPIIFHQFVHIDIVRNIVCRFFIQ